MNNQTQTPQLPDNWPDCSPAQLAYLALNGSYGQQLVAKRLLEAIAKDAPAEPACRAEASERRLVKQAFPKGRWTV